MKRAERIIKQSDRNSKQLNFYLESNKCHNLLVTNSSMKKYENNYLGFFIFYQPKATSGSFFDF
jgi:hypothetical protein